MGGRGEEYVIVCAFVEEVHERKVRRYEKKQADLEKIISKSWVRNGNKWHKFGIILLSNVPELILLQGSECLSITHKGT